MSLLSHGFLLASALLAALFNLLLPATCIDKWPISASPQAMLMEDKIRLGSTPPNCYNRCNACNPCSAVQVPTMPSLRAEVKREEAGRSAFHPLTDQPNYYSKDSNYKPLGWKCRCRDRLYNP